MLLSLPTYDISDWSSKPWFHTKGTREKLIVEDENGKEFYFKTSLEKPDRHYPYEFWSEIIATHLGLMFNVPILNYDIAILGDKIGCISPSMVGKNQELIEGIQYLQAYDRDFDPEKKADRDLYSFQLIEKALQHSGLSFYMKEIIRLIIFDSIIGNQDRHQENWGVIIKYISTNTLTVPSDEMKEDYRRRLLLVDNNAGYRSDETFEYKAYKDLSFRNQQIFAPIYDSGSSLGRELDSVAVNKLLHNKQRFDNYIRRGKSEVRWQNVHLNHEELVRKMLVESDYPDTVSTLRDIISRYSEKNFEHLLNVIDKNIPIKFAHLKIPAERKRLILRLVTARVELLKALL